MAYQSTPPLRDHLSLQIIFPSLMYMINYSKCPSCERPPLLTDTFCVYAIVVSNRGLLLLAIIPLPMIRGQNLVIRDSILIAVVVGGTTRCQPALLATPQYLEELLPCARMGMAASMEFHQIGESWIVIILLAFHLLVNRLTSILGCSWFW